MEDNVGGMPGSFPQGQQQNDGTISSIARSRRIARIATLLNDVVDGSRAGGSLHSGGLWRNTGASPEVIGVGRDRHAADEQVSLPGAGVFEIIKVWSRDYDTLDGNNFDEAIVKTMLEYEVPVVDACQLIALHERDGLCRYLPDDALTGLTLPAHEDVSFEITHLDRDDNPKITMSWQLGSVIPSPTRISCSGIGYREELTVDAGVTSVEISELPFDASITCSIAPLINGEVGELVERRGHTPAEPVGSLSGLPRAGGAEFIWLPTQATRYLVRTVLPEARELGFVTEAAYIASNLESGTGYIFEVVAVDATGRPSDHVSDRLGITAGARDEIYVSQSMGSDGNSGTTPGDPKLTLAAAIAEVPDGVGTTVFVEEGSYDAGYLSVRNKEVIIQGGMIGNPTAWTLGTGQSDIRLASAPGLLALPADLGFNAIGRDGLVGFQIRNSSLVLRQVDISLTASAHPSLCLISVASFDSDVVVEDADIRTIGSGECFIGMYTNSSDGSHRTELLDTNVLGYAGAGQGSTTTDVAGIYSVDADDLRIIDSSVSGMRRSNWNVVHNSTRIHGLYTAGARSIRIQRSTLSTADGAVATQLSSDYGSGAVLRASESIVIDNSAFRGAEGVLLGYGLLAASDGGTVNITMMNSTAVFGHSFAIDQGLGVSGDIAAAVALTGAVRRIDMQNNLLVFARSADWRLGAAALDLNGLGSTAQQGSRFVANVFSYPAPDSAPGAGGPKVMCDRDGEFSEVAVSEAQVNQSQKYLCNTGGSAEVQGNKALSLNPGSGPAANRHGVAIDVNGAPDASPGSGVLSLLSSSASPLPASLQADMSVDRSGFARSASNPGIGAFVIR